MPAKFQFNYTVKFTNPLIPRSLMAGKRLSSSSRIVIESKLMYYH